MRTGRFVSSELMWCTVIFALVLSYPFDEPGAMRFIFHTWPAALLSWEVMKLSLRKWRANKTFNLTLLDLTLGFFTVAALASLGVTRLETLALFRPSLASAAIILSFVLSTGILERISADETFLSSTARSLTIAGITLVAVTVLVRSVRLVFAPQGLAKILEKPTELFDNDLASFFARLLPFFILMLTFERSRARSIMSVAPKVLWLLGMALSTVAAFVGGSFVTHVSTSIGLVFSAVMVFRTLKLSRAERRRNTEGKPKTSRQVLLLWLSLLTVTIVFVVMNWSTDSPALGGFIRLFDTWVGEFRLFLRASLEVWFKARFFSLFGRGPGTLSYHLPFSLANVIHVSPEDLVHWTEETRSPILRILPELGTLGLAGASIIFFLTIVRLSRALKSDRGESADRRKLAYLLPFVSVLAISLWEVFTTDSVFEVPNLMLLSLALGVVHSRSFDPSYSVSPRWLGSFNVKLSKVIGAALLGAATLLAWGAVYIDGSRFLSDVHFKRGLDAFTQLSAMRHRLRTLSSELADIESRRSNLQNFGGPYVSLSAEYWHQLAKARAERLGIVYDYETSERERLAKIEDERRKFNEREASLLEEKRKLETDIPPVYRRAVSEFLQSVRFFAERGDVYFYLGGLALEQTRLEEIRKVDAEKLRAFFDGKFDELQRVALARLREDLRPMLGNEELSDVEEVRSELIKLQMLLDSIALYQTSTVYQTNRDTYLSVAIRYGAIHSSVDSIVDRIRDDDIRRAMLVTMSRVFNRFVGVALRTTYVWPATWHRFPSHRPLDIESFALSDDPYRLFSGLTVEVKNPINADSRKLLFALAEREVRACTTLEKANLWGVPDGTFDFVLATAFEHGSAKEPAEAIVTLDQLLDLYSEAQQLSLQKYALKQELEQKFSSKLRKLADQLGYILDRDEKGYLSKAIGDIFLSQFSTTVSSFLKANFRAHIENYYRSLFSRSLKAWRTLPKSSLWKEMVRRTSENFRYQLEPLQLSETAHAQVNQLLVELENDPDMLRHERYGMFIAGYDFAKETIVVNAQRLLELYATVPEAEVVEAWRNVVIDGSEVTGASQVLNYLRNLIERYGA